MGDPLETLVGDPLETLGGDPKLFKLVGTGDGRRVSLIDSKELVLAIGRAMLLWLGNFPISLGGVVAAVELEISETNSSVDAGLQCIC